MVLYRDLISLIANQVVIGDAFDLLQKLPDNFVHCIVTSPPYYALRDYGVEGQLGLEATPELYIERLTKVFKEARRVLRDDGVLWLNIGDSYSRGTVGGIKDKDLIGIPWMLAFALRAEGWYLRNEVIWEKAVVMPESVRDRPTRSHEQVFLFSKSPHYFYDQDAEREPHKLEYVQRRHTFVSGESKTYRSDRDPDMVLRYDGVPVGNPAGRNLRTVWKINPQPYKGAHFAVYPPKLPERCIKLGTSEHGACSSCGAPWVRILERVIPDAPRFESNVVPDNTPHQRFGWEQQRIRDENPPVTMGWKPTCTCDAGIVPCVVLDPFSGSGTTLAVAVELGRSYLGLELNPKYKALIEARLRGPLEDASEMANFEADFDYMAQLMDEFDGP